MFKMIVFDMDGTITPSRGEMKPDMVILFKELLKKYKVGIISGGDFVRFQIQILQFLGDDIELLKNLYICPTQGGKMYVYKNGNWEKLYSLDFSIEERKHIISVLENAIEKLGFKPEKTFGELIEDRETLICYALLGQEADQSLKSAYDPDLLKRKKIREYIKDDLKGFEISISGSSSIDIIREGFDKAFGIQKMMEVTLLNKNQVLFVGDRIIAGGNDFPPLEKLGITSKKVFSLEDTMEFIKELLK
ncbi:HAD-IIB family hydrolase [Candidatus Gracilibacteria bacterium]|nr:HAD-IIB family hydrolase [Candidatus Gracilibacteria bacterium]